MSVQPYYSDADVTLHHGDALTMPVEVADVFVIDPPYSRAGALHTGRTESNADLMGSDQFWLYWFTDVARRLAGRTHHNGHGFIFTDYRTVGLVERAFAATGSGWRVSQCLVWDRDAMGLGSPFRASHELIAFVRGPDFKWTLARDMRNVLRFRWPYGAHENHEAEKPVALLSYLIDSTTDPGATVLDLFAGSGSTLVAARNVGRRSVGVELEERYCKVAARRLAQGVLPLAVTP